MKFLQVHNFYPHYLDHFYAVRPQLESASYQAHIRELVDDGFSGNHLFAPYMNALGYETMLVIANAAPAQVQWARENGVQSINPHTWQQGLLHRQIETFKPDILYISSPIEFDSRFVRTLNWRPKFIFGWRAAVIPPGTDFSEFEVILSSDSLSKERALKVGAKRVAQFVPGFPEFVADKVRSEEKKYDVVFAGQASPEHTKRVKYLTEVAKAPLGWRGEFSTGYYLFKHNEQVLPAALAMHNQGERWGMEMFRAVRGGRINLNVVIDFASSEAGNMRLFEVTGAGSFMLNEEHPSLAQYFEPGKEVETFKDLPELLEKIYYYLEHPQKREEIAKSAQERCLRQHGMKKRVLEFEELIKKHMGGAPSLAGKTEVFVTNYSISSAHELLQRALKEFEGGATEQAFSTLIEAKRCKSPVQYVDYLRAMCFLKMNKVGDAREALKEELRYFPASSVAQDLLSQILDEERAASQNSINADPEFKELESVVRPYTMMPAMRLYSLYTLARSACQYDIPGNFVECGVAAGGSSALLAYIIKKYSKREQLLFSCDSFEGMPAPTQFDTHGGVAADATGWGSGTCAAGADSLLEICRKLGVDGVVRPIKGYFENTLPQMRSQMGTIALLNMDGDWYESTKAIINNLYDQVSPGGFIQVDDYGHWDGCKRAFHEFESARRLTFTLNSIDGEGVWFQKQ